MVYCSREGFNTMTGGYLTFLSDKDEIQDLSFLSGESLRDDSFEIWEQVRVHKIFMLIYYQIKSSIKEIT